MLKQRIPWPLKFCMKLLFGAAGVRYRVLKRAGVVEHGRMEQADFARSVFDQHVTTALRSLNTTPSGTLLELGPGDSVATGAIGRAAGFAQVMLIDAGRFADLRPDSLERLMGSLGAQPLGLRPGASAAEVLARLRQCGVEYDTEGLKSLQRVATGSVAHSFSNVVLQHVYRDELPQMIAELGRVHGTGSSASHAVNFADHFSGGFLNHRFPEWIMESALMKRANLYTNRVGPLSLLDMFLGVGFDVRGLSVDFFDPPAPQHVEYDSAAAFRIGAAGRRVLRVRYLLQKG
jgi:hypothetical protein